MVFAMKQAPSTNKCYISNKRGTFKSDVHSKYTNSRITHILIATVQWWVQYDKYSPFSYFTIM